MSPSGLRLAPGWLSGSEVSSAFALLAARGTGITLGIGTSVLLARGLGVEQRGSLAELVAWGTIGTQIAAMGFSSSLPFYVARQPDCAQRLLMRALKAASIGWILTCLATAILIELGYLQQFASMGPTSAVAVALLALSGTSLLLAQSTALGLGWLQLFAWTDVLARLVAGLIIGMLIIVNLKSGAGAAFALGLSSLIAAWPIALRLHRLQSPGEAPLVPATEQLRYGVRSWAGLALAASFPRIVVLMLALQAEVAEVGRFAVALGVVETLCAVLGTISQTRISRMAGAVAQGLPLRREWTSALAMVIGLAVPVAATTFVLSPWVVPLVFGHSFVGSAELLREMLPSVIALPVAGVFQTMLAARGMPWLSALAPAFAMLTAFVSMLLVGDASGREAAWAYSAGAVAFLFGAGIATAIHENRAARDSQAGPPETDDWLPPENVYGSRSRVLWMKDRLSLGEEVAEFGCGTGLMLSAPLRRIGIRVVGWDTHRPSIEAGRAHLQRMNMDPEIVRNDPFEANPNGSFDAIIASEVLEHLTDCQLEEVLAALRSRLRTGGRLLITVPNGYGWFELDQRLHRMVVEPIDRHLGVVRLVHGVKQTVLGDGIVPTFPSTLADAESPRRQWFTRNSLVSRLEASGFRVESFEGSALLSGPIADLFLTGLPVLMSANLLAGRLAGRFASGFRLVARVSDEGVQ
jgi:O-antigen/teichoic acid export membrane protein/2-polyprenyl-3-methyl-5-hydroxy-6-metoxy-1,4-benzoquinol methylase